MSVQLNFVKKSLVTFFFLMACTPAIAAFYKLAPSKGNLINTQHQFEHITTRNKYFSCDIWYESKKKYFILKFNNEYFQHCNVPKKIWYKVKKAKNPLAFYSKEINYKYQCPEANKTHFPLYENTWRAIDMYEGNGKKMMVLPIPPIEPSNGPKKQ